jgi:hypothetical protein
MKKFCSDNVMNKDAVLQCIFESLSLFGENTKTALLAQLQKEGVAFTPEQFDIEKFCIVIENLLGRHADFIFVKIVDEFCRKSDMSLEELGIADKPYFQSHSGILESLFRIAEMVSQDDRRD